MQLYMPKNFPKYQNVTKILRFQAILCYFNMLILGQIVIKSKQCGFKNTFEFISIKDVAISLKMKIREYRLGLSVSPWKENELLTFSSIYTHYNTLKKTALGKH